MFFLIRCVFWLTVVFSTIFNSDPGPVAPSRQPAHQAQLGHEQPSAGASAQTMSLELQARVTAALQHLWNKTTSGCAGTQADCMAIAARLSDFAREHPFDAQTRSSNWAEAAASRDESSKAPERPAPEVDVPLPPVRPRDLHPARSGEMRSAHARSAREHFSRS